MRLEARDVVARPPVGELRARGGERSTSDSPRDRRAMPRSRPGTARARGAPRSPTRRSARATSGSVKIAHTRLRSSGGTVATGGIEPRRATRSTRGSPSAARARTPARVPARPAGGRSTPARLAPRRQRPPRREPREHEQVLALDGIEAQHPRQRVEHVERRVDRTALLEPRVPTHRHAGEERDLLAAQTRGAAAVPGGSPTSSGRSAFRRARRNSDRSARLDMASFWRTAPDTLSLRWAPRHGPGAASPTPSPPSPASRRRACTPAPPPDRSRPTPSRRGTRGTSADARAGTSA